MPTENEKQLTAIEWLFNRLQPLLSTDGDLLESAITAYAVAKTKERQQLIDFGDSCIRNAEYGFTTEKHFNNTFKTQ